MQYDIKTYNSIKYKAYYVTLLIRMLNLIYLYILYTHIDFFTIVINSVKKPWTVSKSLKWMALAVDFG